MCVQVCAQTVTSDSEHVFAMATKEIRLLPLWILQRMANAKIEQDIVSNTSLHQRIITSILLHRIEEGEELIHDVIQGVVGHIDSQGQCFIDTRNVLNGIDTCSKVIETT